MTSSIPGKKNLRGVYNGYAVDQSLWPCSSLEPRLDWKKSVEWAWPQKSMSGGSESRFVEKSYAAYAAFYNSFVEEDGVWVSKKGEVVAAKLIGRRPRQLSEDEYRQASGEVVLECVVHINAVDGFAKNRAICGKSLQSFVREFKRRGFLKFEPIYAVLLCDGQLVNDSGVSVVVRSDAFAEGVINIDRFTALSICVVGGNHRMKALKMLGVDYDLGCEDATLDPHLLGTYIRGNAHNGLYPIKIIAAPTCSADLVEFASLDNIKNNVSRA